jgi:ABC-type branched-subunit amino acid transport system substrate-binding protein
VHIALREINVEGGVLRLPLQFYPMDSETDPEAAKKAVMELVNDRKVVCILGGTSVTLPSVIPLLDELQVPLVTPWAGTIELDARTGKWMWRVVSSDLVRGTALALRAFYKGGFQGAFMTEDRPGGVAFLKVATKAFKKIGGKVTGYYKVTMEVTPHPKEISQLIGNGSRFLALEAGPAHVVSIIKEARKAGFAGPIISSAEVVNRAFIKSLGSDKRWGQIEGIAPTGADTESYRNFEKIYFERAGYRWLDPYTVFGYDATIVLALAIIQAGEADPLKVNKAIKEVSSPPGIACESFAEGLKLLKQGEKINFAGASGNLDFVYNGNVIGDFGVFKINPKKEEWEKIETIQSRTLLPMVKMFAQEYGYNWVQK